MTEAEAHAVLATTKHVTLIDMPAELQVRVSPKADQTLLLLGLAFLGSIACLVVAFLFWRYAQMRGTPLRLVGLGVVGFIGGLIGLLVRLANGRPKEQVVLLRPRQITVDRYLMGDHIVRTYGDQDVRCVIAEGGSAFVSSCRGQMAAANGLSTRGAEALAFLIGSRLWPGQQLQAETISMEYGSHRLQVSPAVVVV